MKKGNICKCLAENSTQCRNGPMACEIPVKDRAARPGWVLWSRHSRNWPAFGGGIIPSCCPCSDLERQLPTPSLGKHGNCVGVGLGWQDLRGHNPALVGSYASVVSSCWAARWGPAELGRSQHKWPGVGWTKKDLFF